ncbi:hypothetical protein ASG52_17455 [Methylobacterium sp. Leaf456]|uniref:hypothetical protein n=1 Tax=Methylobacterium sp. Leaf456 TaxID=1736382 RepID=UPI0006FB5529|nr:hypothetical protein [Methylobacterium sp. Leaf456]KQT61023.1 hypothetical protein ASG52_17455 [Methylobacterium sp. Leaf456]
MSSATTPTRWSDRPDLVTTDLGLDRLWNRTITLLVLMGALAVCIYGALHSVIRNRRAAG